MTGCFQQPNFLSVFRPALEGWICWGTMKNKLNILLLYHSTSCLGALEGGTYLFDWFVAAYVGDLVTM